jgi:hypothetical protein
MFYANENPTVSTEKVRDLVLAKKLVKEWGKSPRRFSGEQGLFIVTRANGKITDIIREFEPIF